MIYASIWINEDEQRVSVEFAEDCTQPDANLAVNVDQMGIVYVPFIITDHLTHYAQHDPREYTVLLTDDDGELASLYAPYFGTAYRKVSVI